MTLQRIENNFLSSNTFVLIDGNKAILIDCGDVEKVDENLHIDAVFLTHPHFDHIYGLSKLLERQPNCKVYILRGGIEYLASDRQNLSRYHETPYSFVSDNIYETYDGDLIEISEKIKVRVYATPGHNPVCASYIIGNYFFTGDSYIPGVKTVFTLPRSNKADALNSEEYIKQLLVEGMILCPGHGEIVKSCK